MSLQRRVNYQDISWFMDLYGNEQLELDPPYQRRSIWSPRDRRFFLDSIFRGFPSPTIFLHKTIDDIGRTKYAVVDGKQRLETIMSFIQDKIYIDKEYGDTRLEGKKWSEISQNIELRYAFLNYQIPVEFVNVDEGLTYVNEIFDRLNRNTKKLVDQELRHAMYDGWFITFVEKESEEELDWQTLHIVTTSRSKRMADVQFLSELLIVVFKMDVSGFDQRVIDSFYANFENPEESQLDVKCTQDEAKKTFVKARKLLVKTEEKNSIVDKYAKSFKDFYSLWSIIAINLERLKDFSSFAQKYCDFMDKVITVAAWEDPESISDETIAEDLKLPFKYHRNNIGASTEAPQRKARYESLLAYILAE